MAVILEPRDWWSPSIRELEADWWSHSQSLTKISMQMILIFTYCEKTNCRQTATSHKFWICDRLRQKQTFGKKLVLQIFH